MSPNDPLTDGYVTVIPSQPERLSIDQDLARAPASCPFQAPCWKFIRAPLARKGYIDDKGKHHKIYVPYICSYQNEGDIESCGRYQTFDEEKKRDKIDDTGVSTERAS